MRLTIPFGDSYIAHKKSATAQLKIILFRFFVFEEKYKIRKFLAKRQKSLRRNIIIVFFVERKT